MGKQVDHNSFWLIRQNPITKIGVFPYLGRQISEDLEPSKIYQVLRPESELFAKEALESFNGLPITIGHALLGPKTEGFTPAEDKGVDGTTGTTAERKGDKVVNDIKLFSERIKDEVNNGKKELSAGYFCDFVPEKGVWHGRAYDFVQRNIRGNHIALVDKGRSGHDVRVMDSAEGLGARQFVCDAMNLEGKFEENEIFMKKKASDAQWEESKHKRDSDGKFSSTGGGTASGKSKSAKKNINYRYPKIQKDGDIYHVFYANGTKSKQFDSEKEAKKYSEWVASQDNEDLGSKNHGNSGQDAATEKENKMDKREIIREIMAIAAKPADQFQGGEEEKVETIAKLAEKIAYNPSEAGANDTDPEDKEEKGACDTDEKDVDVKETDKDEDKKPASLDEMEKELLARMGRKAELVNKLTPIIGAFDSAVMTEKEVADYACKKLGLSVALDEAPAALKGYLAAHKPSATRVTFGAKKTSAMDESLLNDFKEGK